MMSQIYTQIRRFVDELEKRISRLERTYSNQKVLDRKVMEETIQLLRSENYPNAFVKVKKYNLGERGELALLKESFLPDFIFYLGYGFLDGETKKGRIRRKILRGNIYRKVIDLIGACISTCMRYKLQELNKEEFKSELSELEKKCLDFGGKRKDALLIYTGILFLIWEGKIDWDSPDKIAEDYPAEIVCKLIDLNRRLKAQSAYNSTKMASYDLAEMFNYLMKQRRKFFDLVCEIKGISPNWWNRLKLSLLMRFGRGLNEGEKQKLREKFGKK